MKRHAYKVRAYRSGKWWALEVSDVPGAFSQCRRLDQAEPEIRDAIALVLDVPGDSFDIDIAPDVPEDVTEVLERVRLSREQQERSADAARAAMQEAARVLIRECELSTRDAGALLGVSHQRISQVMNDEMSDA